MKSYWSWISFCKMRSRYFGFVLQYRYEENKTVCILYHILYDLSSRNGAWGNGFVKNARGGNNGSLCGNEGKSESGSKK